MTHQVEMAIERHERSHKHPAIQNSDPHAVVHVLQHLAAPRHRLEERERRRDKGRGREIKRAEGGGYREGERERVTEGARS